MPEVVNQRQLMNNKVTPIYPSYPFLGLSHLSNMFIQIFEAPAMMKTDEQKPEGSILAFQSHDQSN